MNAGERREHIINILKDCTEPVSGSELAKKLSVSRQVIVTDIALLRAKGLDISSTPQGYKISGGNMCERIFKVHHLAEETEVELNLFVDCGAVVKDIFVSHRTYGVLRAELNIHSRMEIQEYMNNLKTSNSSLLSSITDGYHYHTIVAPTEKVLDIIEDKLWEKGYLAKTLEYEPEDFVKDLSKRKTQEEE